MDWVAKGNNAVRQRVAELANSSASEHVRDQAGLMLAIVDGNITPISKNRSFEEGEGNLSADWSYWVKPDPVSKKGVGRMLRSADRAHDGERSLLCDSMYRGGPVIIIRPLLPGRYCALAWVYVDLPYGTKCVSAARFSVLARGLCWDYILEFNARRLTMARRRNLERERYWRGVIREQRASGLGISAFCRKYDVPQSSF